MVHERKHFLNDLALCPNWDELKTKVGIVFLAMMPGIGPHFFSSNGREFRAPRPRTEPPPWGTGTRPYQDDGMNCAWIDQIAGWSPGWLRVALHEPCVIFAAAHLQQCGQPVSSRLSYHCLDLVRGSCCIAPLALGRKATWHHGSPPDNRLR